MPDDTYLGRDIPEPLQQSPSHKKDPRQRPRGVQLYLVILATVFVVASLVLGVVGIAAVNSNTKAVKANDQRIEQLQVDTNDNLCNQSAYSAGNTCQGGDGNG